MSKNCLKCLVCGYDLSSKVPKKRRRQSQSITQIPEDVLEKIGISYEVDGVVCQNCISAGVDLDVMGGLGIRDACDDNDSNIEEGRGYEAN